MNPVSLGAHVLVSGTDLGVGKVVELAGDAARVAWFESVALPVAHESWAPLPQLKQHSLSAQTRVFWDQDDRWLVGRIVGGDRHHGYALRLPNSEEDLRVPATELHVRWNRPIADPMDVLIALGNESPHFRDTRMPFLAQTIRQRAAAGGLETLLSSAVELFPHQVRAAAKVLSDPVQRYLLADEVGLGKTIEAGLVIRQHLLDHPASTVWLFTPEVMRRQWRQELATKFFVEDFVQATVQLVAHEDLRRVPLTELPDLVVVDEAHHLVEDEQDFAALRGIAAASPRLLLLSATPVLHRELQMLRMLHLLDPVRYRLDDLDAFRVRVARRHDIAKAFYALDPSFPPTIPDHLATITSTFTDDDALRDLAAAVDASLDDGEDAIAATIADLRGYVGETYRLHRRVIRHRRTTVLGARCGPDSPTYEVTGRSAPAAIHVDLPWLLDSENTLEAWRASALQYLDDHPESAEELREDFAVTFRVLVEQSGDPGDALRRALQARIARAADGLPVRLAGPLLAAPSLPEEAKLLEGLPNFLDEGLEGIVGALLPAVERHEHVVVFATSSTTARALALSLRRRLPGLAVAVHCRDEVRSGRDAELQRWLAGAATVLVADASAEEGLNLQSADAVVHVGLPWTVNRLEQRLGRVDRYGEPPAAAQYVLLDSDESGYLATWLRALVEDFEVFSVSLGTLQYVLAELQSAQDDALLDRGAAGLETFRAGIREQLAVRRREIEVEDMLEGTFAGAGELTEMLARLDRLESDWQPIRTAIRDLLSDAPGNLGFVATERPGAVTRFERSQSTLVPRDVLLDVVRPGFEEPYSFNRTAVLRRPGLRLARSGSPLVSGLERLVQHDDRGQACALWRYLPTWPEDDEAFFGLDYLVEADIRAALDLLPAAPNVRRALRRRGDQFLPPFGQRVWLGAFGSDPVTDPAVLDALRMGYRRSKGDKNLSWTRQQPLFAVLNGPEGFREACERARTDARTAVAASTKLAERGETLAQSARQCLDAELAQGAARRSAGDLVTVGEEFELRPDVAEALVAGVRTPSLRPVAVALVVLSSRSWERACHG